MEPIFEMLCNIRNYFWLGLSAIICHFGICRGIPMHYFWFNGLNLFISKHMFVILEFVEP